jgi:hypothetical protein
MIQSRDCVRRWIIWMVCVSRVVLESLRILKSNVFVSVESICSYTIPKENKEHKPSATTSNNPEDMNLDPQLLDISDTPDNHQAPHSGLRLFPPPLFSRQAVPQGYKYVFISFLFSIVTNLELALRQIVLRWSPLRLMKRQAKKKSV